MNSSLQATFALVLILSLAGCGKTDAKFETVDEKTARQEVGPFPMKFSRDGAQRVNEFTINVVQAEGFVDFQVPASKTPQYLVLESYTTQVAGCSAKSVEIYPLWYANSAQDFAVPVEKGQTFLTTPGKGGVMRIVFRGLQTCEKLSFKMKVQSLAVGKLESTIQNQFRGNWKYEGLNNKSTLLEVYSDAIYWTEKRDGEITCQNTLYPKHATNKTGGWIVASGGGLICQYKLLGANSSRMNLICYGENQWGCGVPKNMTFVSY